MSSLIVPGESEPLPVGAGAARGRRAGTAVVLLSGGLGSAVALYQSLADGHRVAALTLEYGQPPAEVAAAGRVAQAAGVVDHVCVRVGLAGLAPCPRLTPHRPGAARLPVGRTADQVFGLAPSLQGPAVRPDGPPPVNPAHVPGLHLLLMTLGTQYAEVRGAGSLYAGFDGDAARAGFPGTRGEFFAAWMGAAAHGTRMGAEGVPFQLRVPLVGLPRSQAVAAARALGVPTELTLSCLTPGGLGGDVPCHACDACAVRLAAHAAAGVDDPGMVRGRPIARFPGEARTPRLDADTGEGD